MSVSKTEILTKIQRPLWNHLPANSEANFHQVGNTIIQPKECIKYLGVQLDKKLSFKAHLQYITEKCQERVPLLQKIYKNMYGSSYGV